MSPPEPAVAGRALVTGAGNPGGIGAAICRRLAADGVAVAFTVQEGQPRDLEAELRAGGAPVAALDADLADPGEPERLLDAATAALGGPPAVLVNNAAHSERDGWQALSAAGLDAHHAVNLRAAALLSTGTARRLAGAPGAIVNLTSGQGAGPMPEELAYAASKGALEALTISLAAELAPLRIRVNAVSPGVTDTGWITPDIAEALRPRHPFGRFGTPEDAARLVAFLVSEEGRWITGQVIYSEGGFTRG